MPSVAGQVPVAGGRAAGLAARGLQHAARGGEHDLVRRDAEQRGRQRGDPAVQRGQFPGVVQVRLGYQDKPFGPCARVRAAEHCHPAVLHAGEPADGLLGLVGVQVAAAADDDVLHPPGQVQLTARQVAEVTGVHPGPAPQGPGGGLVAEVPGVADGPVNSMRPSRRSPSSPPAVSTTRTW